MAFLDELKDKAEELRGKAMDLAEVGVAKSRQMAEIAKLNMSIVSEEEAMRKAYVEIGKLYYAERGMAPDPAYAALCEKITSCRTSVEEYRTRIAEVKAEGGDQEAPAGETPEEPDLEAPVADFPADPE